MTAMGAYVYMVRCRDGRYYVGSTRGSLEQRINQHNDGTFGGFTTQRRPVHLAFHQWFERITDAIAAERQVKGWSRAKNEALIRGDFGEISRLAKNRTEHPLASPLVLRQAQDEEQSEGTGGLDKGSSR